MLMESHSFSAEGIVTTTVQAVLDAIGRHGLLASSEHERMVRRWRKPGRPQGDDPVALVRWLVINRYATLYQADLLLAGREGELEIGQYRVVDRVLTGAAEGCVEATDALGRPVMIQFAGESHRPGSPEVARFLEQGKAASKAQDSCLWRVLDCGVHSGRCYLVRESIHGETLGQLVSRGKIATAENLARMLAQVLQGLYSLHQSGLQAGAPSLESLALVRRQPAGKALKLLYQPGQPLEANHASETVAYCRLFHEMMANSVTGRSEIPELLAGVMEDLVSPMADARPRDAAAAAKSLRVALAALEDTPKAEPVEELELVVVPKTEVVSTPVMETEDEEDDGLGWARPWLAKAGLSVRDAAFIAGGALAMILLLLTALFAVGDLVPILALGLGAAGGVWTERWIRTRLAE